MERSTFSLGVAFFSEEKQPTVYFTPETHKLEKNKEFEFMRVHDLLYKIRVFSKVEANITFTIGHEVIPMIKKYSQEKFKDYFIGFHEYKLSSPQIQRGSYACEKVSITSDQDCELFYYSGMIFNAEIHHKLLGIPGEHFLNNNAAKSNEKVNDEK